MEDEHSDSMRGVQQGQGGIMDLQNNLDIGPGPWTSGSDENENPLTENGQEEVDGSPQTDRKLSQQDSENNNEEVGEPGHGLVDNCSRPLAEALRAETPDSPKDDTALTTETGSTGAVSERCPLMSPAEGVSGCLAQTSDDALVGGPLVPRPCPTLVAFLQELLERSDHTLLPHCLHQIAEDFFLEENYEWAVQFLKLERLYHERLLSNLARLQEQWEACQRDGSPARTMGAGLEESHMEMLTRICGTHRRSTLRDEKCVTVDKALRDSLISGKPIADREPDTLPVSCCTDGNSESPGTTKVLRMEDVSLTEHAVDGTAALGLQQRGSSTSTHDHQEGMPHSAHPPAVPTSNMTGRHCPDDSVSVGGGEKGLCEAVESRNNARLEASLGGLLDDSSLHPEKEERQTDLTTDHPESVRQAEGCDSGRTSGLPEASLDGPPETGEAVAAGDKDEGGADAGLSSEMSLVGPDWLGEEKEETGPGVELADSEGAEDGEERPEIVEVEVSEESTELEDDGYGADVAGDGPAEEAGGPPHDSLDDLAKRIQVEEITPASGLVSILKRRTSPEVTFTPAPPKQTSKRKVRFKELDEVTDQDEVGGDSWLLLLLLCLVTVVISVGGTALYCALGDVQSSVCTDFSRNVDFYFSQAQRGLEELRHWLSPGPL